MLVEKYYKDQYLKHHGIKDQKWGRRRYQNYDGSLTPAGRERYREMNRNDGDKTSSEREYDNKKRRAIAAEKVSNPENDGRGIRSKTLKKLRSRLSDPETYESMSSIYGSRSEDGDASRRSSTSDSRPDGTDTSTRSSTSSSSDSSSEETDTSSGKKKDKSKIEERLKAANAMVGGGKNITKNLSESIDIIQDLQRKQKKQDPDVHVMSNAELQAAITRMDLERRYNSAKYDNEVNIGAEKAKAALDTIGTLVGVAGGVVTLLIGIDALKNGKKS